MKLAVTSQWSLNVSIFTREQAMLDYFLKSLNDAVLNSAEAHQKQQIRILINTDNRRPFAEIIYDILRSPRT